MQNDIFAAKFFSGANSPSGFVSRFNNLYDPEGDWFAYIIKGGPGTGKSTLMKKAASTATQKNIKTELIYCSSDPDSLDAVIFSDIKVCILDGTAPHTMDPIFPGVSDTVVNLGECWDADSLREAKSEIIKTTKENSYFHKRSQRYLSACGALHSDSNRVVSESVRKDKVIDYTNKLSKRILGLSENKSSKETVRLISGITPNGLVYFEDTISMLANNIYIIEDEYSAVSNIIMSVLRKNALACGYDIITCYCPMSPMNKIETIIIPELSIAFAVSNSWHPLSELEAHRRIHARRFMDPDSISSRKQRLGFNRKMERELLNEAIYNLQQAKSIHDKLETYYTSCMNYDSLNEVSTNLISDIFGSITNRI